MGLGCLSLVRILSKWVARSDSSRLHLAADERHFAE